MDIRKWYNKYSIDIQLVYNSEATKNNYKSQVLSFLNYFKMTPSVTIITATIILTRMFHPTLLI